jgi:hypothetical protein
VLGELHNLESKKKLAAEKTCEMRLLRNEEREKWIKDGVSESPQWQESEIKTQRQ